MQVLVKGTVLTALKSHVRRCQMPASRTEKFPQRSMQLELVRVNSCPLSMVAFFELRRNIFAKKTEICPDLTPDWGSRERRPVVAREEADPTFQKLLRFSFTQVTNS